MDPLNLPSEDLQLYFKEVKDSQQSSPEFDDEHVLLDEVEQATDFLQKAGLSDLSKLYYQGKEITDCVVNNSVRYRHLTEKQAQTVRSRVRTLNKTLRSRQPRRKQRQDVRDVTWSLETSSTGSRSRSATPDSLDSITALNEELTSDEDQQLSLPSGLNNGHTFIKGKLKWTTSEPIPVKVFNRTDKGDVAHLGSETVVLKGYYPIKEYPTLQRQRSGSDPSQEAISKSLDETVNSYMVNIEPGTNNEAISFEGCIRQHAEDAPLAVHIGPENVIAVDVLNDSEYQYLKPLLWVEVTAIYDQHKISIVKRKASSKNKRGNVFGVNLSTLVMRDMPIPTDTSMVPQVYQRVLDYLNKYIAEDGILRLAGHRQKIDNLCKEIEGKFYTARAEVDAHIDAASVHDLTGVLKKLLRELPDPVFTMELLDMFFKVSEIPTITEKVKTLNLLVLLLPIEHRNTFRLLLTFFGNIVKHEKSNRMNLHNVAMIMAPSFFPPRFLQSKVNDKKSHRDEIAREINNAAVCCSIIELLIQSGEQLFNVPAELARQAQAAQDRKELGKEKKAKQKKKLQRSSTNYESGAIVTPRIKRDYYL